MIRVICPGCHARFATSDTNARKTGRCPKCGSPIRIPSAGPAPAGAASPRATVQPAAQSPAPAVQAAAPAAASPGAQPAAAETAPRAAPAGGEVGMGQVFLWIGQGMTCGLRNVVPLTLGLLVMLTLDTLAWALCVVPGVFLEPPLVAGFVLIMLAAARGESGALGKLFAGFSGGRYWPSMGIVWLLALIFTLISIPISILLFVVGVSSVMLLLSKGVAGLLVLAVAIPIVYSPMVFLTSRLAWAMPLVLDGRAKVAESLAMSWRLTGKVARGFGLFVQMLVLSLVSLVACALMVGVVLMVFGLGGLVAVSGGAPGPVTYSEALREVESTSALPAETPEALHERRVRQLYRRMDRPLPPAKPDENTEAYWYRADRELRNSMTSESLAAGGQMQAALAALFALSSLVSAILIAALGVVVAMPGMVAYRDMCHLAQPAAGTSAPPRL